MVMDTDPFISRDDLGNKLKLDLSQDGHALACVDAACDMCRTISEQNFNRGTADAFALNGSGTEVQLLPEYPVNAVSQVVEDAGTLSVGDYVVDKTTGALIRVPVGQSYTSNNYRLKPSVVWNRGRSNIQVIYDHGWDLANIPRDVRMVALNLAARFFQQGPATFEALGARQVRYDTEQSDLTKNELRVLIKYKRVG
jgi:hypothetical protein